MSFSHTLRICASRGRQRPHLKGRRGLDTTEAEGEMPQICCSNLQNNSITQKAAEIYQYMQLMVEQRRVKARTCRKLARKMLGKKWAEKFGTKNTVHTTGITGKENVSEKILIKDATKQQ